MEKSKERIFFEKVFEALTKGDLETYFTYFDDEVQWTWRGHHERAQVLKGIEALKQAYKDYMHCFHARPIFNLFHLVVEDDHAGAMLFDVGKNLEGKDIRVEYWFYMKFNESKTKILIVDNYVDSRQLANLFAAAHERV